MYKRLVLFGFFAVAMFVVVTGAYSQTSYKTIPMPAGISSVNEEFSGMVLYKGRIYLLPQYGSHKETMLNGDVNIYSITADSINRVITQKDTALTAYKTIKVVNLNQLPAFVKQNYEGFEAISIVNKKVYLAIETTDTAAYCFLLKGVLDTNNSQVLIDPQSYIALKRPRYVKNAGFESLTYLPKQKKLLALYEFNAAAKGNTGFLIDPSFKTSPQKIEAPFAYFRITDITVTNRGKIYGINYFYNGDYNAYLDNGIVHNPEAAIKKLIPSLSDSLNTNPGYLKYNTFARIVTLNNYKDPVWKQVAIFNGYKNNWEGLALFDKGALIITDANRSPKQASILAYIQFK